MGKIRYIIIAKQCEVTGKSLILDGCLKKSFSSVYDLGKRFFGHPSRIDDFLCNLTQFCYISVIDRPYAVVSIDLLTVYIHFYLACIVWCYHAKYIVCDILMFTCISVR